MYANQGGRISERNPSHLLFPATLLCISVGLVVSFSEATSVEAHIQAPNSLLMRIDQLCLF